MFPGFGRRKSGASNQKAEVRGPNWRENVFFFFLVQDLRQRWHFEVHYPG